MMCGTGYTLLSHTSHYCCACESVGGHTRLSSTVSKQQLGNGVYRMSPIDRGHAHVAALLLVPIGNNNRPVLLYNTNSKVLYK
jgi:hypothetical protein